MTLPDIPLLNFYLYPGCFTSIHDTINETSTFSVQFSYPLQSITLPKEIWEYIFSFATNNKDLLHVAHCSKNFRIIARTVLLKKMWNNSINTLPPIEEVTDPINEPVGEKNLLNPGFWQNRIQRIKEVQLILLCYRIIYSIHDPLNHDIPKIEISSIDRYLSAGKQALQDAKHKKSWAHDVRKCRRKGGGLCSLFKIMTIGCSLFLY